MKELIEKALDALYLLEDKTHYEVSEIGMAINKLQEMLKGL